LFVAWGHNALDTRKLQRNPRARILGLILINLYTATGILCLNSYRPFTPKNVQDLYQLLFLALMVTVPFFVMGVFTDQDEKRFREKPLRQTFHFKNLFLNHPATGPFYLIVLLTSISLNVLLCTAVPAKIVFGALFILMLWIFPWLLFFISMRITGMQARGIFVSYILGISLVILASAFYHSAKSTGSIFDFFLVTPILVVIYVASLATFLVVSLRFKSLRQAT
jgi:hypothetical protein